MKASLQHQHSCPSQGHLPRLQPLSCHLHLSPQTYPPHRWGTWPYPHWTSSPQVSAEVVQGCSSWGKQGHNCCMRPLFHVEPFFPHCFFWGNLQFLMTSSHRCCHHRLCLTLKISPHHCHQMWRSPPGSQQATWRKVQQLQVQVHQDPPDFFALLSP